MMDSESKFKFFWRTCACNAIS